MRLSKMKFTISFVAAALIIGFSACTVEDDPNGMITEKNSKNYSIEYTNDTNDVSRGYRSTNLAHAGAIVKLTFDNASTSDAGVLGAIFDLHNNETNSNAKDFYVFGFRNASNYYISKFEGVTDLQAANFGAPTDGSTGDGTNGTTKGTKETEIVSLGTSIPSGTLDTTDGKSIYIYFVETASAESDYDYKVYILPKSVIEKVAAIKDADLGVLKDSNGSEIDISSYKVADCDCSYTSIKQNKFAVYANVYAGKTLKGSWQVLDTYKEADLVED